MESMLGLGDPRQTATDALVSSSLSQNLAGGYVEYLGFVALLCGVILLARLVRGDGEVSTWLASCAEGAVAAYVAVTVAGGMATGAAAIYDGHHGVPLETAVAVGDIRSFAFFLSGGLAGVVALAVSGAARLTGMLPRWVTVSGYAVGAFSILAIPGSGLGLQNVSAMVWLVWVVAVGVVALRRARAGMDAPVHRTSLPV